MRQVPSRPPVRARQVPLPERVRDLSSLSRIDYSDCFRVETPAACDRTAERWARAILEGPPPHTRTALRRGWAALGLRLGAAEDASRVLGWRMRDRADDAVVLAASSLIGADAEVVCVREPGSVLVATFMRIGNPFARLVWAAVERQHRRVVPHLLARAVEKSDDAS